MRLNELELKISAHAYKKYIDRVERIGWDKLHEQCRELLARGDYSPKGDFLHLGGVWWVFSVKDNELTFISCYGSTHIDVPTAVAWAARHNDRIRLDGGFIG